MIIGNAQGSRDVSVQDQTTPIVDAHLNRVLDTVELLAPLAVDDLTASIRVVTVPLVGDVLGLKEAGGFAFYQGEVLTVTPVAGNDYDIELDTPLDFAFGVLDIGELQSINLAVDGSVTPQIFEVNATGLALTAEYDITRLMANLIGTSAMDDGKFGNLTALDKGIVIREANGTTKNIFNAKTNGEIKEHAFDLFYSDKAPAGQEGMSFRRTFGGQSKNGVVIRITGKSGDGLRCIVQDDLTLLVSFRMTAQGHFVERG